MQLTFDFEQSKLLAGLLVAVFLSACGTSGPHNTSSEGADGRLMLKGHDPVAYFTLAKHTPGRADIKTDHEGVTYRFMSDENKAMFLKEPAKYVPQYGGFCANGIVYGIPWGGDADTWTMIDGKLYIFGGQGSKKYFLMEEKQNLALANRYWADEIKGSNGFVQRYKRLAMRVPHYKTGAELEAEWQKKQPAK